MSPSLEQLLAKIPSGKTEQAAAALDYFSLLKPSDEFEQVKRSTEAKIAEVLKVMTDTKAASAFTLAATNASCVRNILAEIIAQASLLKAKKNSPRQSCLFRILELEAESEALGSLLYRALSAQLQGPDAQSDAISAFLCSLDLLERLSGLIFSLDTQEPQELFPAGTSAYLKSLSILARLNRALGENGTLAEFAAESRGRALGVLG